MYSALKVAITTDTHVVDSRRALAARLVRCLAANRPALTRPWYIHMFEMYRSKNRYLRSSAPKNDIDIDIDIDTYIYIYTYN